MQMILYCHRVDKELARATIKVKTTNAAQTAPLGILVLRSTSEEAPDNLGRT